MRVALALAPLGRRMPLPRLLRPLVEIAPPWRSTDRPPDLTPAAGERRARVGLLLGCVQRVLFGDVNAATARVLAADGCEVVVPPGQACCGALHLHAGRRAEGHQRAHRLAEQFRDAGAERIVVNAAGCGSHLKDAGLDLPVVDVSEVLAELGPRAERRPIELSVAFEDSCHLLHAQRVQLPPRELLRSIPGLELAEPAEQAICCGSAGIYNLVQPSAAAELGARKAENVAAAGADAYASANPGCLVQVSAALRRAGNPLPALHPVEVVDASIRGLSAEKLLRSARR
jgi:glycolate oxidase iron-sulfur subunit